MSACHQFVVPFLIQRLADPRESFRISTRKLLLVYRSCCPNEVDSVIRQNGLQNLNPDVNEKSLEFLIEVVEQQRQTFAFKAFTPVIVSFIKNNVAKNLYQSAMLLLTKFFKNVSSKIAKLDLVNEFIKQKTDRSMVHTVLMQIDPSLIPEFNKLAYPSPRPFEDNDSDDDSMKFVNSATVKITTANPALPQNLRKTKSTQVLRSKPFQDRSRPTAHQEMEPTIVPNHNPELDIILNKLKGYPLESIKGVKIGSTSELYQQIDELLIPFTGKETEFNWTHREKNIIHLRSILRGNVPKDFPHEFAQCLRTFSDAFIKAISSLRTSLASNGCQLVKEMAIFMGPHLDNYTIESCSTTLIKATSSAKKIASHNAMVAFCTLIANIPFLQRVFNQIIMAFHDKNVQPRLYASTWVQIYITRNHELLEVANSGLNMDQLEKSILKSLTDPNATVRESMRSAFWCFYQHWPSSGEQALSKIDLTARKALERSKPSGVVISDSLARSPQKRPSMKELIVSKNRTLTQSHLQQHPSNSSKTLPPRSQSGGDIGKPVRIGIAQKANRVPSFKRSSLAAAGVAVRSRSEEIRSTPPTATESTKEIFNRTSSIARQDLEIEQKDEVLPQNSVEEPVVQEEDMIIKLLRSDNKDMRIEGISLLKFAFYSKENIPDGIGEFLDSYSINDPLLLKSLYDFDVLPETLKCISPENFLRSFIICHSTLDSKFDIEIDDHLVTLLVDCLSVDLLYSTCAQLINISTNVSLVVNGKLTMQFIKYKKYFFEFIDRLLLQILSQFPISDDSYAKVTNVLALAVDFFQTQEEKEIINTYIELMTLLFEMKPELFKRCLLSHGDSIYGGVSSLVSLDLDNTLTAPAININDETGVFDGVNMSSLFEMTMIQPSSGPSAPSVPLSELQNASNDMTMIMPNFSKPKILDSETSSIKENILEEDEDDDSIYHNHGLNFQKLEKEVATNIPEDDDIEMGDTKVDGLSHGTQTNTVVISKDTDEDSVEDFDKSGSTSRELITQISNVNISSPAQPVANESEIEDIITKSDPFTNISGEKSIPIYEDLKVPDKNYIFLEEPLMIEISSWFTLKQLQYSQISIGAPISLEFFTELKKKCLSGNVTSEEMILFLTILTQTRDSLVSFDDLIEYLDSMDFNGSIDSLVILMHSLKVCDTLGRDQLESLWNLILFKYCNKCEYYANELWFAVLEVTEELSRIDHDLALQMLTDNLINDNQILVALNAIDFIVNDLKNLSLDHMRDISGFCVEYINHEKLAIRKLVIQVLSKFDDYKNELDFSRLTRLEYEMIDDYLTSL